MDNNVKFFKELKKIITENILDIPNENVDKIYETWNNDKDKTDVKSNFVFSENRIHNKQKLPKSVVARGIDLPSWFGNFEAKGKKIVILGIDPLRSEGSFNREHHNLENNLFEIADFKKQVTIGTPYALHEKSTREGVCLAYWTLVNELTKVGDFVYCTDIFKTYYYNQEKNIRSYSDKSFAENEEHKNILEKELELINPDLIIVFGKIAHKILLNENCPKIGQKISTTKRTYKMKNKKIDVFTVIHLSKSTFNKPLKTFLEANEIFDINPSERGECAKAYVKIINQNLNIENK